MKRIIKRHLLMDKTFKKYINCTHDHKTKCFHNKKPRPPIACVDCEQLCKANCMEKYDAIKYGSAMNVTECVVCVHITKYGTLPKNMNDLRRIT